MEKAGRVLLMLCLLALPAAGCRRESRGPIIEPADVSCSLGVGFSFGLLFVSLDRSGDDTGQWPLLFARFSALPLLLIVAVVQFRHGRPRIDRRLVLHECGCMARRERGFLEDEHDESRKSGHG
jgi:hypothetical protein